MLSNIVAVTAVFCLVVVLIVICLAPMIEAVVSMLSHKDGL